MPTLLRAALLVLPFSLALPAFATHENGAVHEGGAGQETGNPGGGLVNPLEATSVEALIAMLMGLIVRIGAIFVVVMIIYTGYKFVAAQGKESEIREARQALLWTLIGGVILLGAQVIATVIQGTVNDIRT